MPLTAKERLIKTLNHEPVDRVCVDFGATHVTGISAWAVDRLRQAVLGEKDYRVKVVEPYQMLGEVDMEMLEAMKLDVAGVPGPGTMFGFRNEGWKHFTTHDGIEVMVPGDFNYKIDDEGAVLIYPEGDTSVPPSGKMPKASFFFDAIPRQN